MKTATEVIAEKFNEVDERLSKDQNEFHNLTRAEQAIWLTAMIVIETEMEGVDSVFDQLLSRSEVEATVRCMNALGLLEEAERFARILSLFDTNNFYGSDEKPILMVWELPEHVVTEVERLGDDVVSGMFADIDDRLYAMLESGE